MVQTVQTHVLLYMLHYVLAHVSVNHCIHIFLVKYKEIGSFTQS